MIEDDISLAEGNKRRCTITTSSSSTRGSWYASFTGTAQYKLSHLDQQFGNSGGAQMMDSKLSHDHLKFAAASLHMNKAIIGARNRWQERRWQIMVSSHYYHVSKDDKGRDEPAKRPCASNPTPPPPSQLSPASALLSFHATNPELGAPTFFRGEISP
ncbi:hypothetical protein BDW59DRAFT_13235 [Aspergillus cavernicola]|uniref:Uncharacterized protein n=1 Tax=Aspergillus cavernicola TaxID=176166 RepID=A0ABR4HKC6_9EURO